MIGGDWPNQDNASSFTLNNNPALAANTAVATIAFGKAFLDNNGNAIVPACTPSGYASGGKYPLYVSSLGAGATSGLQVLTISTSTSIPANTSNLIYTVSCTPEKQ